MSISLLSSDNDVIEEEYDLESYERAVTEFQRDSQTYSFDEAMKELDLL